jgi:hypothetical protein
MLHDARYVVAEHDGDRNIAKAQIGRFLARGARAAEWIGGAHVADDADAFAHAGRQHHAQARVQRRRVAEFRVFAARQIFARHGALGEALKNEVVDIAALGEFQRRHHSIIRGARTGADAYRFARFHQAFPRARYCY